MSASRRALTTALALAVTPSGVALAQAAPTPTVAGTAVTNVATVQVGSGPNLISINSNMAQLTIAERLDVALQASSTTLRVPFGTTAIPFTLTNGGNGTEAFVLAAQVAGADATIEGFAVDRNGDGVFDAAVDLAVPQNGSIPALAPGQTAKLLVLVHGNTIGTSGTLTVHGTALTGSGTPGTLFAGRGDGGGDAIVGPTGATAALAFTLAVVDGTNTDPITLVKSQQVASPNGTSVAVPGATITYSLVANFGIAAPTARIADPIPAGTTYLAGSLTLDGATLSDAADGDAGRFDGSGIAVELGSVAAASIHTVQFKVTIQ